MTVKHAFVSAKPDGADSSLVTPSAWDQDHTGTNDHGHTATGDGGAIAFNPSWKGNWSNVVAYIINDAVSYGGSSYIALLAGTNHQPDVSPTYWALLAQQGTAGGAGTTGDTGAAGAVWRNGAGAPSNSLGLNGDYYLNDTTSDVYFKSSGAYAIVVNIKGVQGIQGIQGPTGSVSAATSIDLTDQGSDPSVPASGEHLFYSKAGGVYIEDHTGAVVGPLGIGGALSDQGVITYLDGTVAAAPGTPASGKLRIYAKTGKVLAVKDDAGVETVLGAGGGGGGGTDYDVSPNPTADDDEFKVTAAGVPSGWSQLGTLDTVNANTDWKSNLHMAKASPGAFSVYGIYKTAPSMPFTMTMKISDWAFTSAYQHMSLAVMDATPTAFHQAGPVYHAASTGFDMGRTWYNNRTSRAGWADNFIYQAWGFAPLYVRMIVASSTNVTWQMSKNGLDWVTFWSAINPGFTIGNVGILINSEDNSVPLDLYVDWVRFGTSVIQPDSLLWQNVGGGGGGGGGGGSSALAFVYLATIAR